MNRILAKISGALGSIPQDKLLHFIAGALIVALCAFIKGFAPYAWVAGVVAGMLKEFFDSRGNGSVEVLDFAATTAGALAMQIAIWSYLVIW
jgi:hypothetical protein|nr:MAG TPA: putative periplasmic lipoprotein [Caudoviricetes sp.]